MSVLLRLSALSVCCWLLGKGGWDKMFQKLHLELFKAFRGLSTPVFLVECQKRRGHSRRQLFMSPSLPMWLWPNPNNTDVPLLILMLRGSFHKTTPLDSSRGSCQTPGKSSTGHCCSLSSCKKRTYSLISTLAKLSSSSNNHKEEQLGKAEHHMSFLNFLQQLASFPSITQLLQPLTCIYCIPESVPKHVSAVLQDRSESISSVAELLLSKALWSITVHALCNGNLGRESG